MMLFFCEIMHHDHSAPAYLSGNWHKTRLEVEAHITESSMWEGMLPWSHMIYIYIYVCTCCGSSNGGGYRS